MYRKNVAGQYLYFTLVNATSGAALTGATVTAKRGIDGAAQASCTGTVTEDAGGQYHIALSQADTNGNNIGYLFTATNAIPVNISIVTTAADPTDAVRFGLTALPNANAEAAGGLFTRGTGAGQIAQDANGNVRVNVDTIKTQAVTCAAPVTVLASVGTAATNTAQTGDAYARLGAPAGASVSVDVAAIKTDTAAVKVQTDKLAFTVANKVDANVLAVAGTAQTAKDLGASATQTGDSFARLGAPAGASVSADVAAIKSDTAAVKAKTDNLPASPAAVGSQMDLVNAPNATAVTAIQSGLATSSALATVAGYVDTEVAAIKAKTDNLPAAPAAVGDIPTANENADALLKRDWTAVTGEAARSVLNALRFLRNKWSVSGATLTVTKEDDSTSAWTGTVTTDAAAEPVIGNDPA